jgi:Leucine-rich repeat (LRR) protein
MEKPEIIKKLEKKIHKKLKQLDIRDIYGSTKCYVMDGSGNIVGLNLFMAELADISFLKDFHHLTRLNLGGNQIADILPLIGLKNQERLVLKNNKITQLPDELVELGLKIKWKDDFREGIILEGNPLETPPIEIVKQGTEAVRNYFKGKRKKGQGKKAILSPWYYLYMAQSPCQEFHLGVIYVSQWRQIGHCFMWGL